MWLWLQLTTPEGALSLGAEPENKGIQTLAAEQKRLLVGVARHFLNCARLAANCARFAANCARFAGVQFGKNRYLNLMCCFHGSQETRTFH